MASCPPVLAQRAASEEGEGSSQTILLARRTRTITLCSADVRSEGRSGYSLEEQRVVADWSTGRQGRLTVSPACASVTLIILRVAHLAQRAASEGRWRGSWYGFCARRPRAWNKSEIFTLRAALGRCAQWKPYQLPRLIRGKEQREALAWVNGTPRRAASIISIRNGGTDHGGSSLLLGDHVERRYDPD